MLCLCVLVFASKPDHGLAEAEYQVLVGKMISSTNLPTRNGSRLSGDDYHFSAHFSIKPTLSLGVEYQLAVFPIGSDKAYFDSQQIVARLLVPVTDRLQTYFSYHGLLRANMSVRNPSLAQTQIDHLTGSETSVGIKFQLLPLVQTIWENRYSVYHSAKNFMSTSFSSVIGFAADLSDPSVLFD